MGDKLLKEVYVNGTYCTILDGKVFLKQLAEAKEEYEWIKKYKKEHPKEIKRYKKLAKKFQKVCNKILKENGHEG